MSVLARRPVQIVVGVVVAVALFGGGYAVGAQGGGQLRPSGTPANTTTTGPTGVRGGGGGAGARGLVSGQILAINSDSITISMRQAGQSGASPTTTTMLILVGSGTRVVKTVETDVKLSDLNVGDAVTVAGTPDTASGTISAQAIVLGGATVLGDILGGTNVPGGRGGAGPSPGPTPTK